MDAISQQFLIDVVGNTPFIGFLIWQYFQQRKDYKEQQQELRELRVESQTRSENLRLSSDKKEEELRGRFESVIQGLNEDRDNLVHVLEKRLSTVESQIKKLFVLTNEIKNSMK